MSIRAIAQELYKAQAKVHTLEDKLAQASGSEKEQITRELNKARQELRLLKNMLEGRKAQSSDPRLRFLLKR